ncbi:ABC transporter permease subunit, partial [Schumannella luteola]
MAQAPTAPRRTRPAAPPTPGSVRAILVKILLLGIVDALSIYAAFVLVMQHNWVVAIIVLAVTGLVNWIYFSRRLIPAKYLTPGLIFLAVFQVFVLLYTGYVGFTNYGTGHNGTKEQAVSSLLASSLQRVEDSPAYPATVVDSFGQLGLLVTDPDTGDAYVGTNDQPLAAAPDAEFDGGKAVSAPGWTSLSFAEVIARTDEITQLAVPYSDDPNDGALRTQDGSNAYRYLSTLEYDEQAGTMTNTQTGVVYADQGTGAFVAPDGTELRPGWQITVGFDNFVRAFTEQSIRGPLVYVTIWTFVFAIGSVALTFILGLLLAITFENARMRGVKYYRVLLVLPYAFPAFLSILVWKGMMNESFGFINQVLFAGADIPWLSDPTLAKASALLVNLWLGFPYMFLICTGALQAIPDELTEAATMDGARGWGIFRQIKLPLLLSTTAPVLIASFAFNFNNFNLVYLLNNGGP